MKPLSIADYLDHLGRAPADKAPPRKESSPFRPRSLPSVQNGEPGPRPAFNADAAPTETRSQGGSPAHAMGAKANSARYLGGAVAGGRRGGQARRYSGEACRSLRARPRRRSRRGAGGRRGPPCRGIAAARREAETDRLEFQRNEYAQLEGAIRSGLKEIEDNVGAVVTRILTPFLDKQVVKRAADELCKAIARLGAAGSPGLMTIRGPERVLALLRPRIADLPVKIASVDDKSAEVVVEAGATQVVTALRSWAKLLASLAD